MRAAVPALARVSVRAWRWVRRWPTPSVAGKAARHRAPGPRRLVRRRPTHRRRQQRPSSVSNAASRFHERRSSVPNAVSPRDSLTSVMTDGCEWVVDARGCDPARIADLVVMRQLFAQVVGELHLTPVADAVWHVFPPPGGITGLVPP